MRLQDVRADGAAGAIRCDRCGASLAGARYVSVDAGAVDVFCSEACCDLARRDWMVRRRGARRREWRAIAVGLTLLVGCLVRHEAAPELHHVTRAKPAPRAAVPARPTLPPGWFGPEWPPSDTSVLAALGRDAWIHPLSGPVRRMPRSDSRVFGAVRPGERPIECRNGHCGVDLGGEIWGEHVHAVHDGIVDFVQRGANPDRGGEFVRIAHHGGTVFSQYFHLAAIPRGLTRGTPIKSGDVIGLLGDTGVKESAPHLHFAVSIKPSKDAHERYVDPEPLVALWAMRVPIDGGERGLVTTVGEPGAPLGSAPLIPGRKRKGAKGKRRGGGPAASDAAPAGEAAPASEEPASDSGDSGESDSDD